MYLKKNDNLNIKDIDEKSIIKSVDLNNDILIRKLFVQDKKYVEIKKDECVICYSHGKICDVEDKKGLYEIVEGNVSSDKDLSSSGESLFLSTTISGWASRKSLL